MTRLTPLPSWTRGAALALGLLAASLAGAAAAAPVPSRDRRFTFDDTKPDLAPAPGAGRLCLVREQIVRKNPMPPERLYLDGQPLGWLPQRAVVIADVSPGTHRLEGVVGCPPLVFECPAGEIVLLRLREVIDEQDAVRARWLLEDPDFAADLVEQMELLHTRATPRGTLDLARRWRTVKTSERADSLLAPGDSATVVAVDEVWFEHPLDPVNLRRDFTTYTGRIEIGPREISYAADKRQRGVRVVIRFEDVAGLRFGGTRSASAQPWIDLFYRSNGETLRASFADASAESEAGYNRMFSAIRARWRAARANAGDAPATGTDGR